MTSRERVRLVLNHQEADRPAIDLGATTCTGMNAWRYRELKRALGIASDRVRVMDLFQMLAQVEPEVQDALDCDFVMAPRETTLLFGLDCSSWKTHAFWDGQTFEVPVAFAPVMLPDGTMQHPFEPEGGAMTAMHPGCRFFDVEVTPAPAAGTSEPLHLRESEWKFPGHLDEGFLKRQRERVCRVYETTDKALVLEPSSFKICLPRGYGSLYDWALKMMTEPEHCRAYLMREAEAARDCFLEYLDAVGEYVDVLTVSYADFGEQDRGMFNPDLFRDFFVPAWKIVLGAIHKNHPHVKIFVHSCGAVADFIPYFIEAGVDILNPVQWTAKGMDLRRLKEEYGDRLVFWGGAVSSQRTLPFGSADEVAREAEEVLSIMAPGGGYVAAPLHNILPEVPVDNIVAMYRAARRFRY